MNYIFRRLTPESLVFQWLLHWRWIPRAVLLALSAWVLVMAFDREPPLALISSWTSSPKPGGILVVRAKVRRDLDRECSATFSRYLFDKFGSRHEATGPQMMTAQGIRNMDALAPGELNVQLPVPINFPAGPAIMTTIFEYRCNPLQDLFRPIGVEMNIPFEVLP